MKLELAHDFLAKKIFEEASIEDKNRAKVTKYLQERFKHYQVSSDLLLNRRDLNYIKPYLNEIDLTKEEALFVQQSKKNLKTKRYWIKAQNYATIVGFCALIFSSWALWERNRFNSTQDQLASVKDTIDLIRAEQRQFTLLENKEAKKTAVVFDAIKVSGEVKDSRGEVLPNCRVALLGAATKTNEAGAFEMFVVLSPEDMTKDIQLTFSKEGYITNHKKLDTDKQKVTVDVVLTK